MKLTITTKKLSGPLIAALFCLTSLSASTMSGTCNLTAGTDPAVNTNPPGTTTMPTFGGVVYTCLPFTIPAGDTLTGVDIVILNDYSLGLPGSTNSVAFGYAITGFGTTALTTSVTGVGTNTSTSGGIVSQTPAGDCTQTGTDSIDCQDRGLSLVSPPNFNAVTVTGRSLWTAGGLGPSGADGFNVSETFTYSPTSTSLPSVPEPASFLLIGGGLIGLATVGRRYVFKR